MSHFVGNQVSQQRTNKRLGHAINNRLIVLGWLFLFLCRLVILLLFVGFNLPNGMVHSHDGHIERHPFSGKAHTIDLAGTAHQTVILLIAQEGCMNSCERIPAVRQMALLAHLLLEILTLRHRCQTNSGIPRRMTGEPGHRFSIKSLHGDFWQQLLKLKTKMPDPTVRQDDICIQDLPRHGVYTAGTNRCSNVIVKPADKVVANVFWVLVHMGARLLVLIVDFNRTGNAHFLESIVPGQHPFSHPTAITHRCRVLDIKHNWILRRTYLERCISFFKMPAVDIANTGFLVGVLAIITVRSRKKTNSLVGFTRLVS